MKLSNLKLNPDNPRTITPEKLQKLIKSIREFPKMMKLRPIVIDINGMVLGGNQRLLALTEMEYKEIPDEWVKEAGELTKDQIEKFIVLDNVGFGEWDWEVLVEKWSNRELEWMGLDIPDNINLNEEAEETVGDDEVPEKAPSITVKGDLYELGEHRVLCGDATIIDDVQRLMDGDKADMVFTDPPYLMDFQGNVSWDEKNGTQPSYNAKHDSIKNDKMSKKEGEEFLDAINTNIQLFCIGAFYITFYRLGMNTYFASMDRIGLKCRSVIIWEKGNHTLSNSDYMSRYEPIFYGWVSEHNFYGGNSGMDVWEIKRTKKNILHPTMKPIPLCKKAIEDGSKRDNKVLDFFLGSGSTLIACEKTKRKCYGIELDEHYCDVIVQRYINYCKINNKPYSVKRNGEKCDDFNTGE